jgi:membrane fusion protein (multidrug efflux system)
MKTIKVIATGLIIAFAFSCGADKQTQLNNLYRKQKAINEKIRKLEDELDGKGEGALSENGILVGATDIVHTEFNHYIEIQGRVDADKNVAVFAEAMGVIDEIYVKSGDQVKKGQVLAKLDDALLQKSLKDLESNYEFLNELYEKQKKLWEQKIGSEVQYLSAKNNKESLENKIILLKEQIDMLYIKAPVDGEVEETSFKIGQTVSNMAPVFRIVNFSGLKVIAEIAEGYAMNVNKGDKVIVYIPDLKKEYSGIVNFVGRYINNTNRTFQIEVRLNDSYSNLKANMIAVLKLNDYKSPDAVVLPINVIMNDLGGSYVYTAEQDSGKTVARRTAVETGVTFNGMVEITKGLGVGEKVITVGFQDLEDGKTIRL